MGKHLCSKSRSWSLALLLAAGLASLAPAGATEPAARKPNVLFIAIDDLRDWVGYLGCRQIKTPNFDRLAARGMAFTRSYCAAPLCNPSRTALLTGLRPTTTGVYGNNADWRELMPSVVTLPQHLKQSGYYTSGAGKIYHNSFPRLTDWNEFLPNHQAMAQLAPGDHRKEVNAGKSEGVNEILFKALDCGDLDMGDYWTVEYALRELQKPHDQPFFLACGLIKPHLPWFVPKKYFDMYPLDKVQLPEVKENDLDDVPEAGKQIARSQGDHAGILKAGLWKNAVQAYLATITFADAMLGRLLDGFDRSPAKENTIIICWSDHGWMNGEKEHWRKYALWEEAARAPFIIVAPGLTKPGSVCNRTVDYMSVYPTVCELCRAPKPAHVQGLSLLPLLANPAAAWDRPAVTTHSQNNNTVRSERWRYIRYADGSEELYDHDADPHEWTNLATDARYASLKQQLAQNIPPDNKANAQTSGGQGKKKGKGGGKKKAE